jgi:hypothetical protein
MMICLTGIISCTSKPRSAKKTDTLSGKTIVKSDTNQSVKIDGFWVEPKPVLKYAFGNEVTITADTVDLPSCGDYTFSPFGKINDRSELPKSLLKNFSITNKTDTSNGDKTIVQSLKLDSSKLLLYFDHDPEAERGSYIIKGEIYDKKVLFTNNIRIGMRKDDFYNVFFTNYPQLLQNKYHVIAFETCIEGLKHIYSFKNDRLYSVKFECIKCSWKIDY